MSTNTPAAQELLRLFKCIVLTGTPVLTTFATNKLLPPYNGNFDLFLEDKKHEIFHLWQSQKLLCCACPPSGCSLKRTNHMVSWIFKKMYDDNGPENRGHIVRHKHDNRKIVQVCLHKFVKRHIPIHELDISVVSFLLRNLANLSPTETTSLDIITTRRSEICHAHAMTCYPMALLNTAWNELENALLDLADPSYKPMIRYQIKNLRLIDLEKEEITDILSNIEKVSKEVKASFNNNVNFLIGMENRYENKSISNTEDIKQHITDETRLIAGQVQQALSGNIQNTEENLKTSFKQRVEKVLESQENSFQNIGTQLHENRSDTKEGHEKTQAMLVEVVRTIQNLDLSVKYEVPANLLVPVEPCSDFSKKATPQAAIRCVFCDTQNVQWKCEKCSHMCYVCKEHVHRRLKSLHTHKMSSLKDIGKNIYYEDQPWYHNNITRKEAVNLLQKHKYMGDGAFLVRESQSNVRSFAIDCMLRGEPKHVQIKLKEMSGQLKYCVGEELFDGLNDVIEFFKSTPLSLLTTGSTTSNVLLTEPVLRETNM